MTTKNTKKRASARSAPQWKKLFLALHAAEHEARTHVVSSALDGYQLNLPLYQAKVRILNAIIALVQDQKQRQELHYLALGEGRSVRWARNGIEECVKQGQTPKAPQNTAPPTEEHATYNKDLCAHYKGKCEELYKRLEAQRAAYEEDSAEDLSTHVKLMEEKRALQTQLSERDARITDLVAKIAALQACVLGLFGKE